MNVADLRNEINYITNLPPLQKLQHMQRLIDLNAELGYLLYQIQNMGHPPDTENSGEGRKRRKRVKKVAKHRIIKKRAIKKKY